MNTFFKTYSSRKSHVLLECIKSSSVNYNHFSVEPIKKRPKKTDQWSDGLHIVDKNISLKDNLSVTDDNTTQEFRKHLQSDDSNFFSSKWKPTIGSFKAARTEYQIYKSGKKLNFDNYRPISVLSAIATCLKC